MARDKLSGPVAVFIPSESAFSRNIADAGGDSRPFFWTRQPSKANTPIVKIWVHTNSPVNTSSSVTLCAGS